MPLRLWERWIALVSIFRFFRWFFVHLHFPGFLSEDTDFSFFSLIFRSFALSWLPFWGYRFFVFFVPATTPLIGVLTPSDPETKNRFRTQIFLISFFTTLPNFWIQKGCPGFRRGVRHGLEGQGQHACARGAEPVAPTEAPHQAPWRRLLKNFDKGTGDRRDCQKIARGHRPRALCVRASATWPSPRGGHGVGKFGRWRNYSSLSCFRCRIWHGCWFFSILLPEVRKPRRGVSGFWRRFDRS